MSIFEPFRILLKGKDSEGYRYPAWQRIRILFALIVLALFGISLSAAVIRCVDKQLNSVLPEPAKSIEMSARLYVREFFEFIINGLYMALRTMIDNAWMAAAIFGIIILFLTKKR